MENSSHTRTQAPIIALVGNPNVGKSTLFNALTHLRQHTGNWPGKTVSVARGSYIYHAETYTLVDLPGTYSLHPGSPDEAVTRDFLISGEADATLVVTDATCLTRNLALALQVIEITRPVVVCVNLMDEARKKHITLDLDLLQRKLGCPVVGISARDGLGLDALRHALEEAVHSAEPSPAQQPALPFCDGCVSCRIAAGTARAERIAEECTHFEGSDAHVRDRRLDRLLTSRGTGMAAMLLLLGLVLWLTIVGANLPSRLLSSFLFSLQAPLRKLLASLHAPLWLLQMTVDGIYRTVAWVVSVMLPPMAIFFPLFALLEDAGYLPRVAFNLDHFFARSGAHGRQSLTMCMGLGCNACGVAGCRIIQSERERLLAILTNAFMPCNGRFPTLIALISMFLMAGSGILTSLGAAALLLGCIVLAVAVTLLACRVLSATILRGQPSSFSLELPPYRMPRLSQVLVRSVLDRTLFTLGRAVTVAAPAGALIWCAANLPLEGESLLLSLSQFLDPAGRFLGMDGVILLAFFLGFPANEIVIPCALMGYLSAGALTEYESLAQLHGILSANGWTVRTALCVILFTLFHFPCGTTVLTTWRETRSFRWTLFAIALPTAIGAGLCILVNLAAGLL